MIVGYLLDENVDVAYRDQLTRRGSIPVRAVGESDAPSKQTTDPDILIWCERHEFVLVTNNRRTMPRHLADHLSAGRHIPGIIVLGDDLSFGGNLEELLLIAVAARSDELRDQIVYLPVR
jgi:predicted nuclease of predicted toxin-antitoxin system